MTALPLARQIEEISRTDQALAPYDGHGLHPFRPPCGALPLALLLHFARNRRRIAYWSYDSHDYARLSAKELLPKIRSVPPTPGDVILMHDDNQDTVEVLAKILPEWIKQGFKVEALPFHGRA